MLSCHFLPIVFLLQSCIYCDFSAPKCKLRDGIQFFNVSVNFLSWKILWFFFHLSELFFVRYPSRYSKILHRVRCFDQTYLFWNIVKWLWHGVESIKKKTSFHKNDGKMQTTDPFLLLNSFRKVLDFFIQPNLCTTFPLLHLPKWNSTNAFANILALTHINIRKRNIEL